MAALSYARKASSRTEARQTRGWTIRCSLFGFAALALGTVVYVATRPTGSVYLMPFEAQPLLGAESTLTGIGALPAFLHVLAFSVLTAAALGPVGMRAIVAIAGTWFGVNAILEIGQHARLAPAIASALPASFDGVPLLENLAPYLLRGTFDIADLFAAALGAVAAVLIISWPYSLLRSSRSGGSVR